MADGMDDQDYQEIGGYRIPLSMLRGAAMPADQTVSSAPAGGDQNIPAMASADRPSLGERIAAKPIVGIAPGARQTPYPSGSTDVGRTTLPPSEVPTPAGSSPATQVLPGLIKQRSQTAQPIRPDTIDPATGKPKYRMGLGSRLLGTVANFASGMGGKGTVEYVGSGATNRRFETDKGIQQEQVANLDTEIGNQEKLAKSQQDLYNEAVKQAYEGQIGEEKTKTAEAAEGRARAAEETAAYKAQLEASTEELNKAKAAQASSTANQKDATRPRQVMGNRTYEKQDDGTWKDIGPAPTKQFAPKSGRAEQSAFDKIERDKQNDLKKAELKARQAVAKLKPFDLADPRPITQRRQDIYDQLEQDKLQAQADYEARIAEKGGGVSQPKQATVKAPPPNKVVAPKTTAKAQTPPAVGSMINVDGKLRKVAGWNPTTKKIILAP